MGQATASLIAAIQELKPNGLSPEEKVDYLTRMSPPPPDWNTLIYALAALAAAALLLWIFRRRLSRSSLPVLRSHMVLASFLWCAAFICCGLAARMFKPPRSFSREAYEQNPASQLETFLREACRVLPEDEGVFLINCNAPHIMNMTHYFLYPRRVFYTQLSAQPIPDPGARLNDKTVEALRAMGADWILDLNPGALKGGVENALLRVASTKRDGAGARRE